jgi:hypothetical protein
LPQPQQNRHQNQQAERRRRPREQHDGKPGNMMTAHPKTPRVCEIVNTAKIGLGCVLSPIRF